MNGSHEFPAATKQSLPRSATPLDDRASRHGGDRTGLNPARERPESGGAAGHRRASDSGSSASGGVAPGAAARPRSRRKPPRALTRGLRGLAALLLLAIAALGATPHEAQAQETLVSNTGQSTNPLARSIGATGTFNFWAAQAFRTGSHSRGYTLNEVRAAFGAIFGTGVRVQIYSTTSGGAPDSSLFTLSNPATINSDASNTFSVSGTQTLSANTTYAVVFSKQSAGTASLKTTSSNAQDAGAASGWSIGDQLHWRNQSTAVWSTDTTSLQIAIVGSPAPNTRPTASPVDVWMDEDTTYTFTAADIGFMDDDPGDTLHSVRIPILPSSGSLKLDGAAVIADQVVKKADIDGGKLTFAPEPDGNGRPYAFLWFYVSDGIDESLSFRGIALNVRAVNDPPTVSLAPRVTVGENTTYTFSVSDFNFMDVDGDTLASVRITTLETLGDLELDGMDVAENQVIAGADIGAGKLTFTPAPGASGFRYDYFGFKVSDGTAESTLAYAMTIDVTSTPAQGAVPGALVSNTGQTYSGTRLVGDDGVLSPVRLAQQFSTGPGGYLLRSVVAALAPVRSGAVPRVSIYTDASGAPGSSLYVLNNPSSFTDDRNNTFTAQGKAILRANTNYWVVFDNDAAGSGDPTLYFVTVTISNSEDPGAARGWSIADTDSRAQPTDWASTISSLRIAIQGEVLSNNANLSALELVDASDGSPIRIGFKPDKTEYRATVARHRGVTANGRLETEITVTPTLSDSNATFVIRERDGRRSVDANPLRPGHQVMLTADGFGRENKFRVKVTAEDGSTRKSYAVRLDRELRAVRVSIHQTPNSTVEQGNDVVFQIRVTDPDPSDDVNLAAIGGSVKFKLQVVCEKRNYGGRINNWGIRNRLAECQDLTLLGARGGDTWGFSRNLTIRDSALRKRTNPGTGVETGTMTLRVGTEPDTIHDDGGNDNQNFQENFTVMLRLLHERDGGPPSFLKFDTSRYHWFTLGSIRLAGHLGDECEHLATDIRTGCAVPPSRLTVADAQATEGTDDSLDFVVTLSPPATETVTVAYATSDGTATAPEDYAETRGTLTFEVGETQMTISVDIEDDGVEDSGETMTLTLGGATGAAIDDAQAIGTIYNTEAGPEALTASFKNVPSEHDGESAFTVRVAFSEALPQGSKRQLRRAMSVTGGSKSTIRRVDDRLDLWEVTVTPSGADEVTVSLASTGACGDEAALCTSDGRALTNPAPATVPGPEAEAVVPLTASFRNVPSEHDGSSAFTLRAAFSEALPQGSKRRMWRGALAVAGGSKSRILRVNDRLDLWEVTITPSGTGAVTVSLASVGSCGDEAALCTADGRALAGTATATVQGPPGLNVADAEVDEGAENAALAFEVKLSRAASGTVTVAYATSDGTAVAPGDYTSKSGTLDFTTGETVKTVSVPVIADAENEASETMTLTLSNPTGAYLEDATATGTITNDGPIPQAWMARFGRTVADQVLEAVDGRLHSARAPGFQATVAGQALSFGSSSGDAEAQAERQEETRTEALSAWLRGEDPGYPEQVRALSGAGTEDRAALSGTRTLSERDLFAGISFSLTGGTAGGGTVSAWGRGTVSRFDGREGELTLDGEVGNLMLGADFVRGRATAGLMLSHARGSGGYRGENSGSIVASLTGLYPYGRYEASDRLSVWGVAGYGEGTLRVEPEAQAALETDMDLAMASVGVRSILMKAPPGGGAELAIKSDALAVRTTSEAVSTAGAGNLAASEADVTRIRLGLEGSRAFRFAGSASLTPSVELGVRHDGGDAETGFGADIGAGLAWSDPTRGLSADMRARGLLTHEDGSFRERGFAGTLAWDPAPESSRGPSLSLTQTVGAQAAGGVEALLGPQAAQALEAANENDANELERRTLEARLGYGFALFDGRYTGTPEIGLGLTDASRETVLGWRLDEETRGGLAFGLDVEGARQESAGAEAAHRFGLGFGWRLEDASAQAFELRFEASRRIATNDDSAAENQAGVRMTTRW